MVLGNSIHIRGESSTQLLMLYSMIKAGLSKYVSGGYQYKNGFWVIVVAVTIGNTLKHI